ncbi:polyhydroxyalkanoate synthesis regulator [Paenibacillus aurantius]|uniref:Polyhydroxyalkanoate synthesis regulator n=1 Tax=Paenibacillus aurantius TaxID=2918900 RepID=A0AA96LE66_9BACL|nr:polyhydroxyalkanoate synthesis regulator [Paenibacillus aurantius]WJH36078.1 polyhydroxyalkanoate synthesis regulator [Paenibacillus sp. CC-CFT747]WNQ11358.1 polyhydroxyalkanoate synthesis regulator [Paenibacillus aurantius]
MSDILKKAIALGLGITAASRDKVQQFVDELVVKGELGQSESRDVVNRLIARGEEHRSEIKRMVQEQVRKVLADLDVATKQDLEDLERRMTAASTASTASTETVVTPETPAPPAKPTGPPSF